MRALVFADTAPEQPVEELLAAHRPDLVLTLGDLQEWMLAPLAAWPGPKMGVHGNHCWRGYMDSLGIIDLHMQRWRLGNLLFAGFEGSHKYKINARFQYEQSEALEMIRSLPPADILVCHSPPNGINDHDDEAHHGLHALNLYLHTHQPKVLLHGHTYPTDETLVREFRGTRIEYVHGARIVDLTLG